jgi:hypothetical protein
MNQNIAVWIAAVAALFSAIFTAVYVWLTHRVLQVTRMQFEASNRPVLCVDVFAYPGSGLLKLRVRNLGMVTAEGLKLNLNKDFYAVGEQGDASNIRTAHAFQSAIPTFAPRAELVYNLGTFHQVVTNPERMPFEFTVTAEYGHAQRRFTEQTSIDLNTFRRVAINPEPLLEEIREIRKVLEKK